MERLKYGFRIDGIALLCPSGVARPIIQDCHSCDSGSNPDSGAIILITRPSSPLMYDMKIR